MYADPPLTLEKFIVIATEAHAGQVDKGGHPYILHPIRVMLRCTTLEERVVAILHDVLEDTDWAKYGVYALEREGLTKDMSEALLCLTRRPEESYEDFIERIALNPLATRVKLADLADNMDVSRLSSWTPADESRMRKYAKARERLREAVTMHQSTESEKV